MAGIFDQIKTFLNRNKDNNQNNGGKEPSKKETVADFSMNEGDHGKIFGVSRKVVSGITIVIITIFAIAFITATSDTDRTQQQRAAIDPEKEKPASDGTNTVTGLPQNYSNYLNNQNFQRAEQQHGGNRNNQQNSQQAEEQRRRQEEARRRAEREAANANSARTQTPPQIPNNYLAQQQAMYQAQLRALEVSQNPQPPASAPAGNSRNQAIEFNISHHNQQAAAQAASPDSGNGNTQVMQTSASSEGSYKMNAIPPAENAVQAGTVIPAVLCTGINSNVDGVVTAVLSNDTFDSMTGNMVLIPAGTKLLGTYDGRAASQSGRVKIVFNQMIFPNGNTYPISEDTFMAMDGAGYSGVKGKVDHHTDRYLASGAIGAGIAALGSIAAGNVNNNSNTYSAGQLAMQGAMANVINATSSLFQKNANVQDTVSVKPGHSFMIYVAKQVQF